MANQPHNNMHKLANSYHKVALILAARISGEEWIPMIQDGYKALPQLWIHNCKPIVIIGSRDDRQAHLLRKRLYLLGPYIFNAGFSLELHLKTLQTLLLGEYSHGHDLAKLYLELPPKVRLELDSVFQTFLTPVSEVIHRNSPSLLPADFKWDLEYLLNKNSQAYSQYRYAFEKPPDSWFLGYLEILGVIENSIQDHIPEIAG